MKKIKISRPAFQIPLENLLKIYRRELRTDKLKSHPSEENNIIENNKDSLTISEFANCKKFFLFALPIFIEAGLAKRFSIT